MFSKRSGSFYTRSYVILLLTSLSFGIANNVVVSLFPLIGIEVGIQPSQITLVSSCSALTLFLVSPWWGRRSDVWGRKLCVLLGVLGYCFTSVVLIVLYILNRNELLTDSSFYYGLFASRLLQAFLSAAMLPAVTAYIIDITSPEERIRGLSQSGAAHGVGAIAGPSLVALAAWSMMFPVYIALALGLVMGLVVFLFLEESSHSPTDKVATPKRLSYFDPRYRSLLLVGVVLYMAMSVATNMMGFYLPQLLSMSTSEAAAPLGMTQASMACATVFGQLVLVQRLALSPLRLLQLGTPIVAVGMLVLAVVSSIDGLISGALLVGLGLGLAGPGFSTAVSMSVGSSEQGAIAGMLAACPALGWVVGPYGGGLLFEIRPELPYVIMFVLLLLVCPVVFSKQQQRQ